ncbi:MAG: DAK2 domain-containing protein [Candidatus Aquidulcis sp.]|nr:MAG: DAK2 domain-containing protein [Candidatus Aquidulcis sp.]RLT58986.1 MAG: DAK2 domain-containing protein [Candidatus Aquidulcis sp.]
MSRKSWDGVELMAALRSGLDRLESRVEEVNALNVFPVPDGDTGTNMLATLKAAIAEGDASLATGVTAIDEVSAAVARGALLGARGNSGVLLSQILRGLPQAVRGRQRARATEIAQSLSLGVLHAYSAVATPTEGTILTVAREVAAAAMKESEGASELRPFLESIAATARISVEKTPTLLAVLREAGVVDSGGAGLQLILEGIANVPSVAPSRGTVEAERRSASSASPKPAVAAPAAPVDAAPTEFGYETVFILSSPATPLDLAAIRAHLETIGESVLVAGDEVTCKVHVHNLRPDEVLAYGISLGDVRAVTIENLDQQSAERATGHAAFNQLADGPLTASARPAAASLGRGTSIVAVAAGAGLGDILRSAGASQIVHGGQTENPSAAEIASAIAHAGTEFVVVLPNNSNIVLAARQAADLSAANVVVIPTRNAAEGIAALLAWDPSLTLEELVPRMEAARAAARTFRVVEAVRDAVVRGVAVKAGQIMALDPVDGIIATGSSDVESIVAALAGQSADLVTLFVGADVSDEQASEFVTAVRGAIAGVEVDLQRGGQPIERVLVSLE